MDIGQLKEQIATLTAEQETAEAKLLAAIGERKRMRLRLFRAEEIVSMLIRYISSDPNFDPALYLKLKETAEQYSFEDDKDVETAETAEGDSKTDL
jgi:hypothetical protein